MRAPSFRFLLVGGSAFVLDAACVWLFLQLGLGPYLSRAISLCISVAFTFGLNRFATFQAKGPITLTEVVSYVGASGVGIGLNYGVFSVCLYFGMVWLWAMIIGTAIASLFNFLAYRRIFKT